MRRPLARIPAQLLPTINRVESQPVFLYNADRLVVRLRANFMAANHQQLAPLPALEHLREAVHAFARFIAELPDTAVVEKACGPKEVLAHLVFWTESYVLQTDALLSNHSPGTPSGSF